MPKSYQPKDHYFYRAKEQGYRARSAFKLLEIQEKFKLIKPGDYILDLGAAPGSFLQILSKIVGPRGKVVGIDLLSIKPVASNVQTFVNNIFDQEKLNGFLENLKIPSFDCITSDLAPKTSGIKDLDQDRSLKLNEQALKITQKWLKPGGNLILKIFQGPDFPSFLKKVKRLFHSVKCTKPLASRNRSFEIYLVGLKKL